MLVYYEHWLQVHMYTHFLATLCVFVWGSLYPRLILRELILHQVHLDLSEFESSKTCLKRVVKLLHALRASQEDLKAEEGKLKTSKKSTLLVHMDIVTVWKIIL